MNQKNPWQIKTRRYGVAVRWRATDALTGFEAKGWALTTKRAIEAAWGTLRDHLLEGKLGARGVVEAA